MSNLKEKINYNDISVFYCKKCLSLKIRHIPWVTNTEFCDECGSTYIEEAHIDEWRKEYKEKFGHEYLEKY